MADSGFSTEANSNTSPRSSRFETNPAGTNPLDLAKLEANLAGINPADPSIQQQQQQQPPPLVEKGNHGRAIWTCGNEGVVQGTALKLL